MGFQTPLYELSEYLKWTTSGKIQLPDFQRGYKWEDERIRSLLVTVIQGHPLGVVMLLKTGSDQLRFKPKPIEGAGVAAGTEPQMLLLDGQQRLTSLTQALTGNGIVSTMDSRGKKLQRKYYIELALALEGEERIDDSVRSLPADGVVRTNFGKDIELDVSTPEKEREHGYFPMSLLFSSEAFSWLFELADSNQAKAFNARIVQPTGTYNIPAIELDNETSKSAVTTVFEKVNTGGLALNVFELLTAMFAGDRKHFDEHGTDFRLNDDWQKTQQLFAARPVLSGIESTDFLQAVTLLTTRKRNRADMSTKPVGISAKREDVLKLTLEDYLEWVEPLRHAFLWVSDFLADRHIFGSRFLPYPKQLVPLAAIKVAMGTDADLLGPRERLVRWFWSGILGELYGGAIDIDDERRESIVNKTAISARTNRTIGGAAPSKYLAAIETKAHIPSVQLDGLLDGHLVSASTLRADDFDAFFLDRRERLCELIEKAIGKAAQRDVTEGHPTEASEEFEPESEEPAGPVHVEA